jgi:hypothetical protein
LRLAGIATSLGSAIQRSKFKVQRGAFGALSTFPGSRLNEPFFLEL